MPHGQHIKDKKKIGLGNFSLDGSSNQTGDEAFTLPRPKTNRNREPTPTHKLPNTHLARLKQKEIFFIQKDTQPGQKCSEGHITPNPTPKIYEGDASLLIASINQTRLGQSNRRSVCRTVLVRSRICKQRTMRPPSDRYVIATLLRHRHGTAISLRYRTSVGTASERF
jgi:hypothetical protein